MGEDRWARNERLRRRLDRNPSRPTTYEFCSQQRGGTLRTSRRNLRRYGGGLSWVGGVFGMVILPHGGVAEVAE